MFKIFNAIKSFFTTIITLIETVVSSIITLLQVLLNGIPALINTIVDLPPFMYAGVLVTISICLMLTILGRRSS